jgi:CHAD domain-containing protein
VGELGVKLAIGDTFVIPPLFEGGDTAVATITDLPELELGSIYHDTVDLRLARSGVTLRYRIGDEGGPCWSLKLPVPNGDPGEHEELSFAGGPADIPAAAKDLVSAWSRRGHLAPAAALSTRRRRWRLTTADGAHLADLIQDDVSVLDGERVIGRFRELELESRGAALSQLQPIVVALQRAGATNSEPVPKSVRALGPRAAAAPDVVAPAPDPHAPAGEAVRFAMANGTQRLMENDAPTRLGEVEGVHQMRVATRRLRGDIGTFEPLIDAPWGSALADELRWLGDLLGAVRDRDVQLASLASDDADLQGDLTQLRAAISTACEAAREELMAALAGSRYLDLLERLVQAARDPLLTAAAQLPASQVVPDLLSATARRTRGRLKDVLPDSPDRTYHAARIGAKNLRYAADAIGPFVARRASRVRNLASAATAVQDVLGAHQDALVMQHQVQETMNVHRKDASFAFAAGRYAERLEVRRRDLRAAYPEVRDELLARIKRWGGG